MTSYRIHVTKDNIIFAAAHFVSYDGTSIEPLHGHNYRLSVTLEGPLEANAFVYNFVPLKRMMKRIGDELDHRTLLPGQSALIQVESDREGGLIVRTPDQWYRFPAGDVVVLPLPNTTAELLAHYLCSRFREELAKQPEAQHLTAIEVSVAETFGQEAIYREQVG